MILDNDRTLMELKSVLNLIPMGRAAWISGVKRGDYPEPIRLHNNHLAWRITDIAQFLKTDTKTQELLNKAQSIQGFFDRVQIKQFPHRFT